MIPLADTAKQKRTPVVTMVLVAANLCAFGWELWLGFDGGPKVQASVIETHARVAKRAIALAELDGRESRVASTLSHGEQRQLEIALSLATSPRVLLLDEPLAGMGAEESMRMVALISKLRAEHAILLVEHDIDAVFALADTLTVMVEGKVLASGPPAAIRANAQVQSAYLGEEAPHG
jgi:ABC-type branched-subunit amino acid transport system ATPase component